MEDKRTAIAILLCMFILMFSMELVMAPYNSRRAAPPAPTAPVSSSSVSPSQLTTAPANLNSPTVPSAALRPTSAQIAAAGKKAYEGKDFSLEITNLGARISSFKLKHYKAHLDKEDLLDLVSTQDGSPLPLAVYSGAASDDFVEYKLQNTETHSDAVYQLKDGGKTELRYSGTLANGVVITKTFVIDPNSYLLAVNVSLSAATTGSGPLWVEWTNFDSTPQSDSLNLHNFTALGVDNKAKLIQLTDITQPIVDEGILQWISFGGKYFMATLIDSPKGSPTRIGKDGNLYFSRMAGSDKSADLQLYLGPKSHEELSQVGFQLERNVDLGWFTFIAGPLLSAIKLLYSWLGNYGLAIILLTLLIKLLFLPLTKTSFKSMAAMQTLQPEMKALRERITDSAKLNQEMMALYKKHGVNPMGGCFPMLIQLPVFLGLYNTLNYSIELRHSPFALWINDLSSPEHLDVFGIGIPVMVLLMGASMFVQMYTTPSAADPQQQKIMMMMPIIFTISFVIFPFPSGLVLYWLVNNLISIIQQIYLRGHKEGGAFQGTVIASVAIFCVGYLLTLL